MFAFWNARLITRSDDGYVAVTAPRDEPAERDLKLENVLPRGILLPKPPHANCPRNKKGGVQSPPLR